MIPALDLRPKHRSTTQIYGAGGSMAVGIRPMLSVPAGELTLWGLAFREWIL